MALPTKPINNETQNPEDKNNQPKKEQTEVTTKPTVKKPSGLFALSCKIQAKRYEDEHYDRRGPNPFC